MAQAATGFADTVMMGVLGSDIIAAGALGSAMFYILMSVGSAVVSAVSPLVAEAYGAERSHHIGRVMRQGLWLSLMLTIPFSILVWHGDTLLRAIGQPPDTIELTKAYLTAIAWGYFPGLGFAVLRSFVSALSQPRSVIVVMLGGTLLNVAGNYVLAFGKLGLPALGIAGIGLSSALAFWAMFLALAGYILIQPKLKSYQPFAGLSRFEPNGFGELVQVGVPIGLLTAVESGFFTFITLLMGRLGTTTLAAHQIALQTAILTFTIPMGISMAATVRVGQLMGQHKPQRAKFAGFVSAGIAATFMAVMGTVIWLAPEVIVNLYIDPLDPANAAVVPLAQSLLGVAAMFQIVDGVQVSIVGALRGLKDTRIPLLIGLLAYWGIGLTCGWLLAFELGMGGTGLWWGMAIGLAIAAIILTWRFSTARAWQDWVV